MFMYYDSSPLQAEGNEQRLTPAFLELERQKALYGNLEVRVLGSSTMIFLLWCVTPCVCTAVPGVVHGQ